MEIPSTFQRSWSVYGHRNSENDYFQSQKNLQRSMSTRQPKMNLEKLFGEEKTDIPTQAQHNHSIFWNSKEKKYPFRPDRGMKSRSITDSNLHKLDTNEVSKGYQSFHSPKNRFYMKPLQQIPDKMAPIWNNIQNGVGHARPRTEKILQKGGEKFSKAMQGVRTSFNTFSQRFKRTTKRHYKLDNNTPTRTPRRSPSMSSRITPGKLYSPFDVNTPLTPHSYMKAPKRLQYGQHPIRNMYGKENMGLARTPQFNHVHHHRPNWVHFENSPYHQHSASNLSSYRRDPSFRQSSSVHQYENYWP